MKLNKKITVLLPVYNSEKYIEKAITSILNQTYTDFDLLLIDDGSTDDSAKIIKNFNDNRIIYTKNEQNMGITKTLNKGLGLIESEYIIRMDSDDICHESRFEDQLDYMDNNPNVVVAGTNVKRFSDTEEYYPSVRVDSKDLRTELLFNSPLKHPSVILRNEVIQKESYLYSEKHKATEDYGLWRKISEKHEIGNLDKVLLDYRIHDDGISVNAEKDKKSRDLAHIIIYKENFDRLNVEYTDEQLQLYRSFIARDFSFTEENSKELAKLLRNLKNEITSGKYSEQYSVGFFEKYLGIYFRMNFEIQKMSVQDLISIQKKYFKEIFTLNVSDIAKLGIRNVQAKFKKSN